MLPELTYTQHALETIFQHTVVTHPDFTFFWGEEFSATDKKYPYGQLTLFCNLMALDTDEFEAKFLKGTTEERKSFVRHLEDYFFLGMHSNALAWVSPMRAKDYLFALFPRITKDKLAMLTDNGDLSTDEMLDLVFKYFFMETVLAPGFDDLFKDFTEYLEGLPPDEYPWGPGYHKVKGPNLMSPDVEIRHALWDALYPRPGASL